MKRRHSLLTKKILKDREFEKRNKKIINKMIKDKALIKKTKDWFEHSWKYEYQYHFKWLGRPILQFPQDVVAIQELIWKVKPDLIIEIGIARGGSIIFSASMLELIGKGEVLGIDLDIRKHNRVEIEKHPMFKRITMIEGSSVNKKIAQKVYRFAKGKKTVMVLLDSNHTYKHVLREIELFSSLITKGSYLVVFDTMIEYLSKNFFKNRPSDVGNNPKTAVDEFLKNNDRFKIDRNFEKKLLITAIPCGFLKCIKN